MWPHAARVDEIGIALMAIGSAASRCSSREIEKEPDRSGPRYRNRLLNGGL
jgi:hypothetical protein